MSKIILSKNSFIVIFLFQFQWAHAEYVPEFVKSATPEQQKRFEAFFQKPTVKEFDKLVLENSNQISMLSELLRRQAKSETDANAVANVLSLKLDSQMTFIKDMTYSSAIYQAIENSEMELVKEFIPKMSSPSMRADSFCQPITKFLNEGTEKSLAQLDDLLSLIARENLENTLCYSYDKAGNQITTGLEQIIQSNPMFYQKLLNERVKLADKKVKSISPATHSSSIYFCTKSQIAGYLQAAMKEAKKLKPTEKYAFLNKNESCQFGGALTYTTKNDYEFNFIGNPGQGVFQIHFVSLADGVEKLFPFQKQMPNGILSEKDVAQYRKAVEHESKASSANRIKATTIPKPAQ